MAHLSAILKTLPAITYLRVEPHGGHYSENPPTGNVLDVIYAFLSPLNVPFLTNLRTEEPIYSPVETTYHFVSSVEDILAGVPRYL